MKYVTVTSLRKGSYIMLNDQACTVKNIDISKTGKHGHSKARIEAIGIIDGQKRIVVKPGHENIAVPIIEKKRAQVLNLNEQASVMDLTNYETISVEIDPELKEQIKEGQQIEYWVIENKKIIKRLL